MSSMYKSKGILHMKKYIILSLILIYSSLPSMVLANQYDKLEINRSSYILTSKLKKDYSGYEYTITNNTKTKINIVNAQILNGNDGNTAYQTALNNSGSAMATTWAIAGPVGLFTLGIGWIAGLIATPIVWVVSKNNDKKMRTESIPYTNTVPIGYLASGDFVTVKSLVPIGSTPQLKLTIMDGKTKELTSITR